MEVFSFLLSGEDKGSGMDDSESSMNEDLPTPPAKPAAKEEKSAKEEKEEELSDADKEARKRKADALEVGSLRQTAPTMLVRRAALRDEDRLPPPPGKASAVSCCHADRSAYPCVCRPRSAATSTT